MGNTRSSPVSRLARIPPSTAANVLLALFALPLLALSNRTGVINVGPVGELAIQWGLAVAVVSIAVGVEDRSAAELGFRRPARIDFGYLLATAAAALLVFAGTDPLVAALGLPVGEDAGRMAADVGLEMALAGAITAGIVEEVLFRGYPIERLLECTDSPLLAGGSVWCVFTAAHAAVWPLGNLFQIAAVAALFTAVYLRRRTLAPVIGAHVLVWTFSVLGQFYA